MRATRWSGGRLWISIGLAALCAAWVSAAPGTAIGATAPDPSKIRASCFAGNNVNGPFSSTAPVTLDTGAPLVLRLGYNNDDQAADPAYFAGFTATISQTAAFGPARTIDTSSHLGGNGIRTGTVRSVDLDPAGVGPPEPVVVEITSDSAPGVLARCDFTLKVGVPDDFDGDGITNFLERNGLRDPDGDLVLTAAGQPAANFPALGANPCRKDLFVQVGFQAGAGHDHAPRAAALDLVRTAFTNAPIPAPQACPFPGYVSAGGVRLGVVEDPVPIANETLADPNDANSATPIDCGNIPLGSFDAARRPYFLFSAWVHRSANNGQSGLAPCGSRSFIVSLGTWTNMGSTLEQAGTFMHELGHVLGLGHGGSSGVNLKPNYLSVMNYSFQTRGLGGPLAPSIVDYSRSELPTLDEATLTESLGVQGPADRHTLWWGPQPDLRYPVASSPPTPANQSLDWDRDGAIDPGTVGVDVNSDGQCTAPGADGLRDSQPAGDDVVSFEEVWNGANRLCDTAPAGDDTRAPGPGTQCVVAGPDGALQSVPGGDDPTGAGTIGIGANARCETVAAGDDVQFAPVGRTEPRLVGFDDWGSIDWRIGPDRSAPGPGVALPPLAPQPELTEEEARAIDSATAPSTQFDLSVTAEVDPVDVLPADTLTFTTTVANNGTGTATGVRLVQTLPSGASTIRTLPDLAPGQSESRTFAYVVPQSARDGQPLEGRATASASSIAGTPEGATGNNAATASATVRASACSASGSGALGGPRTFAFAARPVGPIAVGSVVYLDVTTSPRTLLASVLVTRIACLGSHARLFGQGVTAGGSRVAFRVDVDDLGAGPGTDRFAIRWPGYSRAGLLGAGNVTVSP
jgi:uncharacterized repeat protein (TIGR01451 family)